MNLSSEIRHCLRSLLIHRLRTVLSGLGVLFGVAAVITMLSIGEGAKRDILEQIEQLGANSLFIRPLYTSKDRGDEYQGFLLEDALNLSICIPGIKRVIPLKDVDTSLMGSKLQSSPEVMATTRHYADMKGFELEEGRFLCDRDQKDKKLICVLGSDIAKELGNEGHLGKSLRFDQYYFEIVGILKPVDTKGNKKQIVIRRNLDKSIFIPLGADYLLNQKNNQFLSEIILQIHDINRLRVTSQLIKKILDKRGRENYQIIIPLEVLKQAHQAQQTFNWVLGSIAALSLLVGGIGIMNIMLATVSERIIEIGIRRAMGANKTHIRLQFLFETLLLTLGGAFLGIVLGITFSKLIGLIAGWKTIVTFWSILLSLFMSVIIGICSGLYPAYKASAIETIKALRYT